MRRVHDISVPIEHGMITFPGNPQVEVAPVKRIADGDSSNVSELRIGTHSGTHVDPPAHFIDGAPTAEALSLEVLVGEAFVADCTEVAGKIGPADLETATIPDGTKRLLLKTRNSSLWRRGGFPESYVALSGDGAQWVLGRGIELVGIDFLSIEVRGAPGRPAHHTLLGAGIVIVEGLDLGMIAPGRYTLVCLPLKLAGGDGSPARAVLIE